MELYDKYISLFRIYLIYSEAYILSTKISRVLIYFTYDDKIAIKNKSKHIKNNNYFINVDSCYCLD